MCTHLHVSVLSTQSKTKLLVIVSKFSLTTIFNYHVEQRWFSIHVHVQKHRIIVSDMY